MKEGEFRNDYERLVDLKSSITLEAKGNLILERELESLEAKIALLVRNRITVQQIIAESSGLLVCVLQLPSSIFKPLDATTDDYLNLGVFNTRQ